jgi:hypothetical protein
MAIPDQHAILSPGAYAWLLDVANPFASEPRSKPNMSEIARILHAAELHGVLRQAVRALVPTIFVTDMPTLEAAELANARAKVIRQVGFELLLRHHGEKVLTGLASADVPAAIVKGPVFARRLYKEPSLRSFTDIDILIKPQARERAGEVMRAFGFKLYKQEYRTGQDYLEDKWLLKENESVSIEIHSDLVHNPRLRSGCSVKLKDVHEIGDGNSEDATAILFVAAAHAALSHQFDRLQHLVDIALAASGAAGQIDTRRLARIAEQCGVKTAVYAALQIAGRVFSSQTVLNLSADLSTSTLDIVAGRLISASAVAEARSTIRSKTSWRRKLLRQAVRLGG